jgi:tRNA threonylcarbamoyladenosine biosynthesis protein TsaB
MPNLKTLSIDTSTRRGGVALLTGEGLSAELRLASTKTHSARLLGSIRFLLNSQDWDLNDLELVAACLGPGSFTGIRIGVATALGLAQSLSIPFAGISGLDAAAFGQFTPSGRLGVVMDAQRRQVYYSEYQKRGRRMRRVMKPALWFPEDLARELKSEQLYLVGDTEALVRSFRASQKEWPRYLNADLFLAASIGRLAMKRRHRWCSGEALHAEPLYIRPPDALRSKLRIG